LIDAGGRPVAQQALITYQARALRQLATLAAYSDKTTIDAEIPAMGEKGQCSLRRTFSAPQSLIYTAVEFVGNTFVKTNVINRALESDVENVQKKTLPYEVPQIQQLKPAPNSIGSCQSSSGGPK
jgi:hypothetical protein